MSARGRRGEGGQTLVMFALVLALMLWGLFAMVVDIDVLNTEATRVQAAAQTAATSGASVTSSTSLYGCGGDPQLLTPGTGSCTTAPTTGQFAGQSYASVCEDSFRRSLLPGSGSGGFVDAHVDIHCTPSPSVPNGVHVEATIWIHPPVSPPWAISSTTPITARFDAAPVAGDTAPG